MNSAVDAQHVSPEEARLELSRILASADFVASRQLTNFLQYIVSEFLAGRSGNLKERSIAAILGRGLNFDPRLDCIVRVTAGKLRRSLDRYYALQGVSSVVCISVPKGGYCPIFCRQDQPEDGSNGRESASIVTAAVPLIAARPKVAVVSFKAFTSGAKERFFADLLADDVAVRLGRSSHLEVIDCTAMRSPSDPAEDLCQLALRLRANFAFGGTVSQVGRYVRVTVRLLNGDSGILAWGDQYDLRIDSCPLEQHDQIADQIVAGIGRIFGCA